MILAMVLAVGLLEAERAIEPSFINALFAERRVSIEDAPELDMVHIGRHSELSWLSLRYYPTQRVENWGRDTIEVVAQGKVYRAVEQFASMPDHRMVRLSGLVPSSDLERKAGRHGPGVVVFVGLRERPPIHSVSEVRLAPFQRPSVAPAGSGGTQ